jgi:hypothetical protein
MEKIKIDLKNTAQKAKKDCQIISFWSCLISRNRLASLVVALAFYSILFLSARSFSDIAITSLKTRMIFPPQIF